MANIRDKTPRPAKPKPLPEREAVEGRKRPASETVENKHKVRLDYDLKFSNLEVNLKSNDIE